MNGITEKQKSARIKNFTKARLKSAYKSVLFGGDGCPNLSEECKNYLKDAGILILNALKEWD